MVQLKWYRKESPTNIISPRSAHLIAVKPAVIRNMFKTAIDVCSGEAERQKPKRLASVIVRENDYVQDHNINSEKFAMKTGVTCTVKNFLFSFVAFRIV